MKQWINELTTNADAMKMALAIERSKGWYQGCWLELEGAKYYAMLLGQRTMAKHLQAEMNWIRKHRFSLVTEELQ
jgi:hypothetical protein